jgi:hypothetical protein
LPGKPGLPGNELAVPRIWQRPDSQRERFGISFHPQPPQKLQLLLPLHFRGSVRDRNELADRMHQSTRKEIADA